MSKQVFIASDHAGFSIKSEVINYLRDQLQISVEDLGPDNDERTDYPNWADLVVGKILSHPESNEGPQAFGVLICGSGQGMAMRANKYPHIRAALCWDKESTALSRQHNNANVLCFGARLSQKATIFEILETFFKTDFEGGRHQTRVDKISAPT